MRAVHNYTPHPSLLAPTGVGEIPTTYRMVGAREAGWELNYNSGGGVKLLILARGFLELF